jgi:hypothetical protein
MPPNLCRQRETVDYLRSSLARLKPGSRSSCDRRSRQSRAALATCGKQSSDRRFHSGSPTCRRCASRLGSRRSKDGCGGPQHPIPAIGRTSNSQARRIGAIAKIGVKDSSFQTWKSMLSMGTTTACYAVYAGALRDAMLAEIADGEDCPTIVDEVLDMPTILGLVGAGRGAALVPASVTAMRFQGAVFRPLRSPTRRTELWVLKRRDDHRPVISSLQQMLQRISRGGAPRTPKGVAVTGKSRNLSE